MVQTAGRFVEQQQRGPAGERAGQLDTLANAERKLGGRLLGHAFQTDERQHGAGGLVELTLFGTGRRQGEGVGEGTVAAAGMGAHFHVVEHRHRREQRGSLERAPDTQRGDVASRALAQRSSVKTNVAATRSIEFAETIEQRGLAGAVRPDQADDASGRYLEGHSVEGDDAAKAHANVGDFQQCRRRGAGVRRSMRDVGHAA